MYHVGELGDCFLLTFKEGDTESNVLIDCGSFRNSGASIARMKKIAAHIKKDLKGKKLDIVAGTHQHNDHLSGFVHAEDVFTGLVQQVWLSWLDNPSDSFARRIYNEQKGLVSQLKQIYAMAKKAGLAKNLHAVSDMLGFYSVSDGGDPEIPAKGIEILKRIGQKPVQYLTPGDQLLLPGFTGEQVKVYVLGPPRNRTQLYDTNPSKDESYDPALALIASGAGKILAALGNRVRGGDTREEEQFPFNESFKKKKQEINKTVTDRYNKHTNTWRQIDKEWLAEADTLALYLDTYTNNSSLVLAFELVKSGKVLLFAADAQTGNWLSWDKIKWEKAKKGFSTQTLLGNTVLYKVGHHASHNATLVAGLEAMQHDELVAMIPVDASDPNITKKNGWKMPAKNLYKRLKEKTKYRVLRMDMGFADDCDPVKNKDKAAAWSQLPSKPKVDPGKLFVEYTVNG